MAEETAVGSVEMQVLEGFPVIALNGYFEAKTYGKLETLVEQLLSQGKNSLVLDFSKCVALNSVAIGQFLFLATKVVEDFQGALLLAHATPVMKRVFDLAGITGFAQIAPTVQDAIAQLQSA